MISVWFLIILNFHGGVLSLPQASRDACITSANFVNAHVPYPSSTNAICVEGIK